MVRRWHEYADDGNEDAPVTRIAAHRNGVYVFYEDYAELQAKIERANAAMDKDEWGSSEDVELLRAILRGEDE